MKEKMVTRTFTTSKITLVGIDEAEPNVASESTVTMEGEIKKEDALKKALPLYKETTFHPSFVKSVTHEEKVLGIPVSKFIELAVEVERPASQQKTEN